MNHVNRARAACAALLAAAVVGGCGGSASKSSSVTATTRTAASSATHAQSATAPSASRSPVQTALAQLQAAGRHLTPQQLQALRSRARVYVAAMRQCAPKAAGDQTALLNCLRQHGLEVPGP